MTFKIIYTSDLHGNLTQYLKLVDYAIKSNADAVIVGGDIAPKNSFIMRDILGQRDFLIRLDSIFLPIKRTLPKCKIFLLMGNDDFAANSDIIEKSEVYSCINQKRLKINDEFDIVGYSYVPITPFNLKDWEKYDLTIIPKIYEKEYFQKLIRQRGFKSTNSGFVEFSFNPEIQKIDSIEQDLKKEIFLKNPLKTVYVFHSPPYGTHLDQILDGTHVGSMALKMFIEETSPYLTLHGHIHETVEVSGEFKQMFGKTTSISSGNQDGKSSLAVVVFDLSTPFSAKREII